MAQTLTENWEIGERSPSANQWLCAIVLRVPLGDFFDR